MTLLMQLAFTLLYLGAFILSLAVFTSQATGNSETLGAARLIRVASWAVASLWGIERALEFPGTPLTSPMVIVAGALAFSEIVAGVRLFRKIMREEVVVEPARSFKFHTKLP
jgi:hypothetical protein